MQCDITVTNPMVTPCFKVAQSDFSVTVPFYLEKLLFHHKRSNSKLILAVVLEKDESF